MTITLFLIQWAPRLSRRTEAFERLKHWFPRRQSNASQSTTIKVKDHVIIVGYGLNGRNLAKGLR